MLVLWAIRDLHGAFAVAACGSPTGSSSHHQQMAAGADAARLARAALEQVPGATAEGRRADTLALMLSGAGNR